MALESLKKLFRSNGQEAPVAYKVPSGLLENEIVVTDPHVMEMGKVRSRRPYDPDLYYFEELRSRGIVPLSLLDVLKHKNFEEELDNIVLFDTHPNGVFPGNHWTVSELNIQEGTATLQFCGNFGKPTQGVEPFTVLLDETIFTGVTHSKIIDRETGQKVSISEYYNDLLENLGNIPRNKFDYSETIYFTKTARGHIRKPEYYEYI